MEERLPKDYENIPLPDFGPLSPSEPAGFAPDQMVRCEQCNRVNAPTRVSCLYCGVAFAFKEENAGRQKPTLRPLEKWEQGYSNILLPSASNPIDTKTQEEVADFLKLGVTDLNRIFQIGFRLPLTRTATKEEALLIERRLSDLGVSTFMVSDGELGMEEVAPIRIRAAEFAEDSFLAFQTADKVGIRLEWSSIKLVVQGRLITRSVAVTERKSGRQEHEILNATETYTDESVLDVFCEALSANLRIAANSFDFSCLGERKALVAKENFATLLRVFSERAPQAFIDDSYRLVRAALETVWPSERQTASRGWRRERPGKITIGAVTETSNEVQFLRYSRLLNYLRTNRSESS